MKQTENKQIICYFSRDIGHYSMGTDTECHTTKHENTVDGLQDEASYVKGCTSIKILSK